MSSAIDTSTSGWEVPEFAASDLSYAVTSSVLEQFAQGHTVGDVLRELVQNEYDARGSSLSVTFSAEGLEVHGNGRVIDQSGWRRLSVMLGTGRVVGDDRDVPQKLNGIGSKNHGLRSLFLVGDRIYVRSGGYQTMLDLRRGALRDPRPDPASTDLPGAHIFVPYREVGDGLLPAYSPAREAGDVELLAEDLAPTLVKLAQPGAPRSLRSVMVSSVRLGRVLTWEQNVRLLRRHRLGGPVLERTIALRDGLASSGSAVTTKIIEVEYQRSFDIPSQLRSRVFPDYFHVRGGRLRIGISFRLKRKRPDLGDHGSFYYPIGFANSATGSAVSVTAPFEMNSDRSAMVDPAVSSWNEWLERVAADFTLDLLSHEWLDSFGGGAFLALRETGQPSAPHFAAKLSAGLRERACWPTRERAKGSRRPRLRVATDLMLGASAELDELIGPERRLDGRLADPSVHRMARDAGAKDFTIGSAIRLRCAGENDSHLATNLGDDAALYYTDFPNALADIQLQEQFARAFEVHRRQLTPSHRSDLAKAPTTLTAAGTLAAPSQPLWVIDDTVASVSPATATQRLHPRLVQYQAIRRLCQPFDMSAWARTVANQAADETLREEDREALYRYLLRTPEAISRAAWPALRRAPIVRDHRGEWVSPAEMIQRRAAGAARVEQALHFPSREIARNTRLLRRLRIRSKLTGTDLVRYAHIVAGEPSRADDFEETLHQLQRLLTRPTVSSLRSIAFLRSTRGGLVAPEETYVRNTHLLRCVGPDANFAAGRHARLHARLGCRTQPDADNIMVFLESLRATGAGTPHPDVLYPALLEALRADGDRLRLADAPILLVDDKWRAPREVLVGRKHRQIFLEAIPVIAVGALDRVYEALGASAEPTAEHWIRFFGWIDERSDSGVRRLPAAERNALRLAYSKLDSLPVGISEQQRIFLDTSGRLHSRAEVRASRYLINDDPRIAGVVAEAGLPISFAEVTDVLTRRFYRSSGIRLLTEVRRHIGVRVGDQRSSPPWFQESPVLDRLQQPIFASAVHAVATAGGSQTAATERQLHDQLREITRIAFVADLKESYRIGPFQLNVASDVATDGDRIALRFVRGKFELNDLLARAVASMAEANAALRQPLADSIFRLLMSDSIAEIERYLAQRGVAWNRGDGRQADDETVEDEDADSRAQVAETLKEQLLQTLPSRTVTERESQPVSSGGPSQPEPRSHPLPSLEQVELREAAATDWVPSGRQRASGGGGGGWFPRSPAEQEQDRALGVRGEELVYGAELKRVRALGYPEARVVWTSQLNPAADHDIRSVADDGGDLWLEVKSTTGRHGRFDWPRAEFELALRARERYVLCRVYEADTASPTVRRERDPVGMLLAGAMRLDISSLAAEVAPLTA
jgi:hypothetical protein